MNRTFVTILSLVVWLSLIIPVFAAEAEDRFAVLNQDDEEVFTVNDEGGVATKGILLTNGASSLGTAPLVLGQDFENRGIVITDKASSNPKNIYIGWNVGTTHNYAEIFSLQEGIAWKNLVLNPYGGNLGIGTTNPEYLIDTGGAYCDGSTWVDASSREYKENIKALTADEAMDTLKELNPVKFNYKMSSGEQNVGFIAEDVPALVATRDRKGMSSMDVVAVLTKVVQEQQKVVQEQKATIAELSRRLAVVERGVKIAKYQD